MRRAVLISLTFVLGVAGCGSGGSSSSSTTAATQASASKNIGTVPTVTVPSEPATKLVTIDVVKGHGATAKPGDTVSVQYIGLLQANGQKFDASWDRGQPFSFKLGAGQVIPGWDQGIVGMKEGGRRVLVIPGDLAYGPSGQPPTIPPNATLVFAVDLLKVK